MEYEYTPKACKAETPTFAGTVTLKALSFDEACEMSEKLALATADAPEAVKAIRQVRELVKAAGAYVAKVALQRVRDGKTFGSWEELTAVADKDCTDILSDVAGAVMAGPAAGNG